MNWKLNKILDFKFSFICIAMIVLSGLYSNSIDNEFQYDDRHSIVENPHIRSLDKLPYYWNHPEYFSRDIDKPMYRPMVLVSLALNYAIGGYDVLSYHLFNISLHILCVILIWTLLRLLGIDSGFASALSILFAIHPICSQPVNYISSRSELLAAVGSLGTLCCYIKSCDDSRGYIWQLLSFLCYIFALSSKSIAIITPVWLIAFEFQFYRKLAWHRFLPHIFISFIYLYITQSLFIRALVVDPVRNIGVNIATQIKAITYYIYLIFVPIKQSIDHAFNISIFSDLTTILSCIFVASLLLFIWILRSGPLYLTLIFSPLIPTMVIPLNVLVNEHRIYLPLVGIVLLISQIRYDFGSLFKRIYVWVFAGILLLLTWKRNEVWHDEYSLWSNAANYNRSSARPLIYMGQFTRESGNIELAVNYFQQAINLEPENATAYAGLALCFQQSKQFENALKYYLLALSYAPRMTDLNYSIGLVLQLMGKNYEALGYYSKLPQESVHYGLSLNNMGTIFESMGDITKAHNIYMRATKLGNSDAGKNLQRLKYNLIDQIEVALSTREWEFAEDLSRLLLGAEIDNRDARFFLGASLFEQHRYKESLAENSILVERFPNFDEGWLQYGNVLETVGNIAEAVVVYKRIINKSDDSGLKKIVNSRLSKLQVEQ